MAVEPIETWGQKPVTRVSYWGNKPLPLNDYVPLYLYTFLRLQKILLYLKIYFPDKITSLADFLSCTPAIVKDDWTKYEKIIKHLENQKNICFRVSKA